MVAPLSGAKTAPRISFLARAAACLPLVWRSRIPVNYTAEDLAYDLQAAAELARR
jgi:hypothetical protein